MNEQKFTAKHLDITLIILSILTGMINKYLCTFFVILLCIELILHVTFSKKTFKKFREDLFD